MVATVSTRTRTLQGHSGRSTMNVGMMKVDQVQIVQVTLRVLIKGVHITMLLSHS